MIWLRRSLAKVFDLALFAAGLHLFFEWCGVSLFMQGCLALLLPLFFTPLEVLLLKCFRTTLGKSIFGLTYDRRFTWHSATMLSLKNGILTLPLFLPLVNLFFLFLYVQELHRYRSNRWDELSKERLVHTFKQPILRTLVTIFALTLSLITFAPKTTLSYLSSVTNTDFFTDGENSDFHGGDLANWNKIDQNEVGAEIYFPQAPEFSIEHYPVPKSQLKLELKQYKYTDAAHQYSLTYTTLPKTWTKWGSNLVLNVGINYVVDKKSITHKKKCKHYNHPALEYKLKKDGQETTGMLILVNDTMYKIEFQHQEELASLSAENQLLNTFLGSFKPC